MNLDFRFALYCFCADYHSGQNSRLYRILSRLGNVRLSDRAFCAIRNGRLEEWKIANSYYKQLVRKYGKDKR